VQQRGQLQPHRHVVARPQRHPQLVLGLLVILDRMVRAREQQMNARAVWVHVGGARQLAQGAFGVAGLERTLGPSHQAGRHLGLAAHLAFGRGQPLRVQQPFEAARQLGRLQRRVGWRQRHHALPLGVGVGSLAGAAQRP
jgi:hypothetical protein